MRKNSLNLFILTILCSLSSCDNTIVHKSYFDASFDKVEKLNGKVNVVETYLRNPISFESGMLERDSQSLIETFDISGKKQTAIYFDIIKNDTVSNIDFFYDANDHLIAEKKFVKGELNSETIYKYDSIGNIIEINTVHSQDYLKPYDSTVKMAYQNKGRSAIVKLYRGNSLINITKYLFNENSDVTVDELNTYDRPKKAYKKYITNYSYNGSGQRVQTFGENYSKTYEYNSEGDAITTLYKKPSANKERVTTYIYEYDSMGNWVSKKTIEYSTVDTWFIRKIKYF